MNIKEIIREAQACNGLVEPVISECAPLVSNLQGAILQDVAVIAAMCGLDEERSKPEVFTAASIFALAFHESGHDSVRTMEAFAGTAQLESILTDLNLLRGLLRVVRAKNIMSLLVPEILRTDTDRRLEKINELEARKAELMANLQGKLELKQESPPSRRGTGTAGKISEAYYKFARVLTEEVGGTASTQEQLLKKVRHAIYGDSASKAVETSVHQQPAEETQSATGSQHTFDISCKGALDDALEELNSLVGLENIKHDVRSLANFLKIEQLRMARGQTRTNINLHAVFFGPPGTGKTTVARLLGKIYYQLGFLAKGHLIETDRAGMVAGYVGQTSLKVDELVKSALDGVLFIDEAYALKREGGGQDYGQEAIDILLKRMEDFRDRLVVIIAGYPDEMTVFLDSNSGVRSRFNRYFHFDHYKPSELLEIFERGFCRKAGLAMTPQARVKISELLERLYTARDRSFGNARLARNIFETAVQDQANRIASVASITNEVLSTLAEEDIDADRYFGQPKRNLPKLGFTAGKKRSQEEP